MEEKNLNEEVKVEENEELEASNESTEVEQTEAAVEEEVAVVEEEIKEEPYNGPVVNTKVNYDFRTMKYFNMYNMTHKRHLNITYIVLGLVFLVIAALQLIGAFDKADESTIATLVTESANLETGDKLKGEFIIEGKVSEITTAYTDSTKYVSFILSDGTNTISCYKSSSKYSDKVAVDDTLTIMGYVQNIEGKVQFVVMNIEKLVDADDKSVVTNETGIDMFSIIVAIIILLFSANMIKKGIFFEKDLDKSIAMHFARQPKVISMNVEVTEESISLILPGRENEPFKYPWAYVTEIVEIPEYFFLYVQKQPIIIEKDPNSVVSGEYEKMLEIIAKESETKPYKKVDKQIVKNPITYVHQDFEGYSEVESEVEDVNTEETDEVETSNEVNEDNNSNE